jgi:phospholipid/cholesterol/gamma-HCH transport system permease protein
MGVEVRAQRQDEHVRLVVSGGLTLANAVAVERALADAESALDGCRRLDVDLAGASEVDGSGAVLIARLLDRLEASGCRAAVLESDRAEGARQVALYRTRRTPLRPTAPQSTAALARVGEFAGQMPATLAAALDFTGRFTAALPKAISAPRSTDWHSFPRLLQSIGADGLPVAAAANLLVGLIVGFIGVSQLSRFGAVVYVPELVVVAHFRELGPLVTAIVVAGRSGAGLASEIATMKVSEEIDALRSMGFDPVPWLVVPRCLALMLTVPVLVWIGDVLALGGAMVATLLLTDMSARAFVTGTSDAITGSHFLAGLIKTPFLALVIGLIACGQGLATVGGAAAVGTRTTTAVVLSILGVIVVSAVFTCLFAVLGI